MRTCAPITKSGIATWCRAARRRCCFRGRLQARALSSDALVLVDHGNAGDVESAKAQFEMPRRRQPSSFPTDQVSDRTGVRCCGFWYARHLAYERSPDAPNRCAWRPTREGAVATNVHQYQFYRTSRTARRDLAARRRSILRKFPARFSFGDPALVKSRARQDIRLPPVRDTVATRRTTISAVR
jgi:hypothetical protein